MLRLLRRLLLAIVIAALLLGGFAVFLAATSARPRSSEGWRRLPNMPGPRGEVAAAVGTRELDCEEPSGCRDGRALVVAGGIGGIGRASRAVSIFDIEGDRWLRGPDLPEARHHAAAAALGGVVYVTGGARSSTDWTPLKTLWALAPDSDAWTIVPGMFLPEARLGHQMVAVGEQLYVIGGDGGSNVLILDPRTRFKSLGAQMPGPRDHLAVAVVGTQIWAIGGRDTALVRRVDIYDTERDEWTEGPPLPEPMSAMAAGALADGIHVVGGEEPQMIGGRVLDRHYVLRPGARDWTEASLPIVPVHGAAAAVFDGRLVIAGGSRRQGALSPLGWTGLVQAYEPPGSEKTS